MIHHGIFKSKKERERDQNMEREREKRLNNRTLVNRNSWHLTLKYRTDKED